MTQMHPTRSPLKGKTSAVRGVFYFLGRQVVTYLGRFRKRAKQIN
jgi:hypothetical protein